MKPTKSSEEGHGRVGEGGGQLGGLAVAPVLDPATRRGALGDGVEAPVRSVSGVVAAPAAGAELEEAHTTVDAGPARRFEESQALAGRIRHAMDRTLPLGTPAPDASLFAAARPNRALHSRTMLLGGRYLAELGAEPEPPTRRAEPPLSHEAMSHEAMSHEAMSHEAVTPRAPELPPTQRMPAGYAGVTPAAPQVTAPRFLSEAAHRFVSEGVQRSAGSEPALSGGAVRASFVRPVGLPTAPPPRRRRTLPPGEVSPLGAFPASDPASSGGPPSHAEDADHEAFALDRPRGSSFPPGLALEATVRGAAELGSTTAVSNGSAARGFPGSAARGSMPFVRIPDVRNPRSSALSNSVILPPPPQAQDYELSSSPSSAPPPLELAATARVTSPAPAAAGPALPTTRPAARPRASLLDLPSAGGNPLAGYEAPRETFWQRSLVVFVVALAVVGLFALGAIAFGFLGTTGW